MLTSKQSKQLAFYCFGEKLLNLLTKRRSEEYCNSCKYFVKDKCHHINYDNFVKTNKTKRIQVLLKKCKDYERGKDYRLY